MSPECLPVVKLKDSNSACQRNKEYIYNFNILLLVNISIFISAYIDRWNTIYMYIEEFLQRYIQIIDISRCPKLPLFFFSVHIHRVICFLIIKKSASCKYNFHYLETL